MLFFYNFLSRTGVILSLTIGIISTHNCNSTNIQNIIKHPIKSFDGVIQKKDITKTEKAFLGFTSITSFLAARYIHNKTINDNLFSMPDHRIPRRDSSSFLKYTKTKFAQFSSPYYLLHVAKQGTFATRFLAGVTGMLLSGGISLVAGLKSTGLIE